MSAAGPRPNAGYRMYNISYDHAELIQHINVFHSFPRGTSTIYLATSAESRSPKLRIKLELWGLSEADVTPPDNDVVSAQGRHSVGWWHVHLTLPV